MLTSTERDGRTDILCQCENPEHRGQAPFTRYCGYDVLEGWEWAYGLLYCPSCIMDALDNQLREKLDDPES